MLQATYAKASQLMQLFISPGHYHQPLYEEPCEDIIYLVQHVHICLWYVRQVLMHVVD